MPKRAAEDSEAKDDQNDLLSKAIKHCWGDSFLDVFRAYFSKHAHKFEVIRLRQLRMENGPNLDM